ncbi:hypothetical protein GCM10027419_23270 [Pandoraea terrae]
MFKCARFPRARYSDYRLVDGGKLVLDSALRNWQTNGVDVAVDAKEVLQGLLCIAAQQLRRDLFLEPLME